MVYLPDDVTGGPVYQLILAGIAGSILGSFLNVVIYRLPRRESILFPRSHCPSCNTPISFWDNIPIISYILLKGKCRHCKVSIPWRYPFVELLMMLMTITLYIINVSFAGFAADTVLAFILLAVFAIDLGNMIIPNRLNLAGIVLAVPLTFRWGTYGFLRGFYGALIGVIILAIMMILGHFLYKRQGVGMGDIKLAIVIGLFLGPFWTPIVFIIAVFLGGMWGIINLVIGSIKFGQEVPFGPFISLGGFCVLFLKLPILTLIEHYLSLF